MRDEPKVGQRLAGLGAKTLLRSFVPKLWALMLSVGLLSGLWIGNVAQAQPGSQQRRLIPAKDLQKARSMIQERKERDQTVWASERMAQRYESIFIDLWDDLRATQDKYSVFEKFPFDALKLGKQVKKEVRDWGIVRQFFGGLDRTLSPDDWQTFLNDFKRRGFEIDLTEWHHSRFEHHQSGKADSTMAFKLYLRNPALGRRYVVKGNLAIEWSSRTDQSGRPIPGMIDATDVTILERSGEVTFKEMPVLTRETRALHQGSFEPVIVYDIDGDGLSEILLVGWNLLYWNRGDFQFQTDQLCKRPIKSVQSALMADMNGDGRVDLLCVGGQASSEGIGFYLFTADSDGRFSRPGELIFSSSRSTILSYNICAGDIDGDGDLDVFVPQYKTPFRLGQVPTPYYDANDGYPAYLLRNEGEGKFTDITEKAGLGAKRHRRTYSSSLVDLDEDGDLDLMVVSDFSGVDLYKNDGTGLFTDTTATMVDNKSTFGMSHSFADYDLDGKLDFYVVGMSSTTARRLDAMGAGREEFPKLQEMRSQMAYGNRMYLAEAPGSYKQPAFRDQVARTGWSWGCGTFDLENDGDPDLYIANGHMSHESARDYCTTFWCHDLYEQQSTENFPLALVLHDSLTTMKETGASWNPFEINPLLMNENGEGFLNVGYLLGASTVKDSRSVVAEDFDADGRVDLLYTTTKPGFGIESQTQLHVLRNLWPQAGHWIGVRLRAEGDGRSPIGAKIRVKHVGRVQVAQVVTGDSYRCQHSTIKHFGLGALDEVDAIEVIWIDGRIQRLIRPQIDRYHDISFPQN